MTILQIFLLSVFAFIGFIHTYWAFGGKWGLSGAIPQNKDGPLFEARFGGTIIIAVIFFTGSVFVLFDILNIEFIFLQRYIYHFIVFVFSARAIGEFKYTGIFKKVKNTPFAKYDNLLFIPLCVSISTASVTLLIM